MPAEPKPSLWKKAWNEPRRFFAGLALFSLIGLAAELLASTKHLDHDPQDWLRKTALATAAILLASFVLGFICFVLAWIPAMRRLLAWLLQRRFFVLACLVTLVALFYAEENWRGKRAWDNCRREWEAKGERYDFKSFIPPPVPDDQNFALTPIVASTYAAYLDKNGNQIRPENTNVVNRLALNIYYEHDYGDSNVVCGSWQKATFTNLKPWQDYYRHPKAYGAKSNAVVSNEFPASPQPQTPAADVLLALSKYDAAIEELREASKLPYSRFPLEYRSEEPFNNLMPHLSNIKQVANTLRLRAVAELQAGQADKALADLELAFRWNDSIRNEPFLIGYLVRLAAQQILIQPIWEGLAGKNWSATQIAELQEISTKQDFLAEFHQVVRWERAEGITISENLRHTRKWYESFDPDAKEPGATLMWRLTAIGFFLMPDGWFYKAQKAFTQKYLHWNLPMVDLSNHRVSPSQNNQLADEAAASFSSYFVRNVVACMLFSSLERTAQRSAICQGQLDLAQTACALERYRLAHGEYPASLDALAPQFINKVPHDLINGQPLHYRRTDDERFILYSVGWNETDDGGVISLRPKTRSVDTDKGDWVWKYPAR